MKVVVDSSALLAILFRESDSEELLMALSQNDCSMSAANLLETSIVIDSLKDPVAIRKLLCKGEDFRFTDIPLFETKSA